MVSKRPLFAAQRRRRAAGTVPRRELKFSQDAVCQIVRRDEAVPAIARGDYRLARRMNQRRQSDRQDENGYQRLDEDEAGLSAARSPAL